MLLLLYILFLFQAFFGKRYKIVGNFCSHLFFGRVCKYFPISAFITLYITGKPIEKEFENSRMKESCFYYLLLTQNCFDLFVNL